MFLIYFIKSFKMAKLRLLKLTLIRFTDKTEEIESTSRKSFVVLNFQLRSQLKALHLTRSLYSKKKEENQSAKRTMRSVIKTK